MPLTPISNALAAYAAQAVRPPGVEAVPAIEPRFAPSAPLAAGAQVHLSGLGELASALAGVQSSALALREALAARSPALAAGPMQALIGQFAFFNQMLERVGAIAGPDAETATFLDNALASQSLLAAGLRDAAGGARPTLESIGLVPLASGALHIDAVALARAFETNPLGVLGLIGDHARGFDDLFAARAAGAEGASAVSGTGAAADLLRAVGATIQRAELAAGTASAGGGLIDAQSQRAIAAFTTISRL